MRVVDLFTVVLVASKLTIDGELIKNKQGGKCPGGKRPARNRGNCPGGICQGESVRGGKCPEGICPAL